MKESELAEVSSGQCGEQVPETPLELRGPTDAQLLGAYTATQSEDAFAEIVARYAGFVYSSALRQTENPMVAEEITQAVFVLLARKASAFGRETVLPGWLFRAVRYAAMDFRKVETRRLRREREAARMNATDASEEADSALAQIAPLLDEALASLSTKERDAILLRFFAKKSFRDIGETFGGNQNSARLRVVRALEKLQGWFQKRGVALPVGLLSGALLVPSLQAAPPAVVASVTDAIVSGDGAFSVEAFIRGIVRRFWWRRWSWRLGSVMVALLLALVATGWLRKDRVQIGAQTRATAMAIDRALSFGDTNALLASIYYRRAEDEQFKPVLAEFLRAAVTLRQQIRVSFDVQPVRLQIWLWTAEQLFHGQPRRGRDNPPAGRITDDFFQPYLLVMVKARGGWKWDFFASLAPVAARERMRSLQERSALCERITLGIRDGEITTGEQALALLQERVN